jgi:aryl carrier-like protein
MPELTASRFVNYSPASGPSVRIYRTGDRARLMPSGEIAFLGRLDDQVKIRGYRIELGEIVACLDRCSGVEASAVVVSDAGDGGPSLVAYVVMATNVRLSASDLREFLASRLPDYMIPPFFVLIAELPMTLNGKLDKSALPAATVENILPNRTQPAPSAPSTGMQQQIADLVASLLGQPAIDVQENFFMAGGHSMFGVQLVARIRDLFGVKLTLRQLFGAPTVAALCAEVARLTAAR